MNQVIYVDILLSTNLIINYFILLATAKFLSFDVKRWKLILAATLAAIYSFYIFIPNVNMWISMLIKIFMSLTIILVAFGVSNKKRIIKGLVCFYLSSFAFCGIIFGVWYFISSDKLVVKNGIVYLDISPIFLLISTILSYMFIRIANIITGRQRHKDLFCQVEIEVDNRITKVRAKVDTGNTLREPFSNIPVIVVEYKYIKNIVPNDILNFLDMNSSSTVNSREYLDYNKKCRVVPFKVVSSTGILKAFKPDKVIILSNKSRIEAEAYVAVCKDENLGAEFEALINPELIEA